MPIKESHDPRETLVRRKYFSLRPQPLEQWLWRQGIPASAERVFWLHWQEGMRGGNWCSSLPLKWVAKCCALDVSSVTRAYQLLGKLGLIRRQDPGRDPSRPFERAVCVTEVRVPRELLAELGRYPDRGVGRVRECDQAPAKRTQIEERPAVEAVGDPLNGLKGAERRHALNALLAQLSANERQKFHEALLTHRAHVAFEEDCRVDARGRAALLDLLNIAAQKPPAIAAASAHPAPVRDTTRKLTVFELARLRRDLHAVAGMDRAQELMREVVWAVEQGALKRFISLHAVRIALKKIREGAWTRPNRMPPNWSRELAQSDVCRSA
jgi:DNA-binding MarR family transcriptional regulator